MKHKYTPKHCKKKRTSAVARHTVIKRYGTHAELCPVCEGKCYVSNYGSMRQTCHGCGGKGWIVVKNSL